MQNFNILLFDKFETLDALGPAEIIGRLTDRYNVQCFSLHGGIVTSSQNIKIETLSIDKMCAEDNILLVPGGQGTRSLVKELPFIDALRKIALKAEYILTVCTGSALLAKTGLLNNMQATSNKRALDWVTTTSAEVKWKKQARWTVDGNIYTSSGVSAGMDMMLGFISDVHGMELAEKVAHEIEYIWNKDKTMDLFCLK